MAITSASSAPPASPDTTTSTSTNSSEILASWVHLFQALESNQKWLDLDGNGLLSREEFNSRKAFDAISKTDQQALAQLDDSAFEAIGLADASQADGGIDLRQGPAVALKLQTDAALMPGASQAVREQALQSVRESSQGLKDKQAEVQAGPIDGFYQGLLAAKGEVAEQDVEQAWQHVLGTFNPEKESTSIYDAVRGIQSGLPTVEQQRLAPAFDVILERLTAVGDSGRGELAQAMATLNLCANARDQLDRLEKALTNPQALDTSAPSGDLRATAFLEAQIAAYSAPRPSDYLLAALVRSGRVADPEQLSQPDQDLLNGLGHILAEKGPEGAPADLREAAQFAAQYLGEHDPLLKGQGADKILSALADRLGWELGYKTTPDNVDENNLDVMSLLAGETPDETATLFYYSSVANQIRQEHPELLKQHYSTEAWLQQYGSFKAKLHNDGWEGGSPDDIELNDDDRAFLYQYIADHQLNIDNGDDVQQLENGFRDYYTAKYAQYRDAGSAIELEFAKNMNAGVGQSGNLEILSAASQQANRQFDANGKPLVSDPYARAAQLARRLECSEYRHTFSAKEESTGSENYGDETLELSAEDEAFLNDYITSHKLDLGNEDDRNRLEDAFREHHYPDDESFRRFVHLDVSVIPEGEAGIPKFGMRNPAPAGVSDRQAQQEKSVGGQPLKDLGGLLEESTKKLAKLSENGISIEDTENTGLSMALWLTFPPAGLLYSLLHKPGLSNRQQVIKDWLQAHGRSTDTLEHSLGMAEDQWRTQLITDVGVSAAMIATFAVTAGAGSALAAAEKGAAAAASAATKGAAATAAGAARVPATSLLSTAAKTAARVSLEANFLLAPSDVSALARSAYEAAGKALPKVSSYSTDQVATAAGKAPEPGSTSATAPLKDTTQAWKESIPPSSVLTPDELNRLDPKQTQWVTIKRVVDEQGTTEPTRLEIRRVDLGPAGTFDVIKTEGGQDVIGHYRSGTFQVANRDGSSGSILIPTQHGTWIRGGLKGGGPGKKPVAPLAELKDLPDDALRHIYGELDPEAQKALRLSSQRFRELSQSEVQTLTISGGDIAKAIEKFPNAKSIKLSGALTADQLGALAGAKKLESLDLSECHVSDELLASIANLPDLAGLQKLDLRNHALTDAGLAHIAKFKKLSSLVLSHGDGAITNDGLSHLAGLKNLTSLSLGNMQGITNDGLSHLAGLKNLTSFDLADCRHITDVGLSHLAGLKNLTSLRLSNLEQMTDDGLRRIAGLKNLSTLDLDLHQIGDGGLRHIAGLKNLTFLRLSDGDGITDDGIRHLAELKNLTSLELDLMWPTDDWLRHLAGLKNLTALNLSNLEEITNDGLSHLAELKNLTALSLSSLQEVTIDGLNQLAVLKNLTSLELPELFSLRDVFHS